MISWVELNIDRYENCMLRGHDFSLYGERCASCRKYKSIGVDSCCFVCDAQAKRTIELLSPTNERVVADACLACAAEFEARNQIGGWYLTSNDSAALRR